MPGSAARLQCPLERSIPLIKSRMGRNSFSLRSFPKGPKYLHGSYCLDHYSSFYHRNLLSERCPRPSRYDFRRSTAVGSVGWCGSRFLAHAAAEIVELRVCPAIPGSLFFLLNPKSQALPPYKSFYESQLPHNKYKRRQAQYKPASPR